METKRNKYGKYQCPCCGHYTLDDKPDNTFQICPVCFWEDDGINQTPVDIIARYGLK